jgi:multimeric flavodoxin WrbA
VGRSFLFVLGSARADGNSERLARRAATHLPADVPQRWIDLKSVRLPEYEDRRARVDRAYLPTDEAELELLHATLAATDIALVSPLYWYSLSSSTKTYLDHWTGWFNVPGLRFQERMAGRTLWAVTALGEEELEAADPLVDSVRRSADYMRMRFGGVLLGIGSRPGQVEQDLRAMAGATTFFS